MSYYARIDGDTMRVNWRLAECLHDCRGFKQWNKVSGEIFTEQDFAEDVPV